MPPVRILLVDDHPIVRHGFRRLLGTDNTIELVAEAESGEQACRIYPELKPDLVVMDLIMPGMGGLETARRLLGQDPEACILVFSVHDNEEMLARALEIGVRGYLTKKSAPGMLLEAIQSLQRGQMFLDPELSGRMLRRKGGLLERLTQREFEVFRLLADGRSAMEIGQLLCISPKTVSVHQTHIMQKLEVRTLVQLVHIALRQGILAPSY
ncbi:response regulator [Sedimenticola hydrogenitrophicus]|uniref:response regulator n=1 Tax=Sedimenticola hydrogenitrophicus TaxID=2967975 RepID=UPI0023B0F3B3|nr:response regulator transcription factor [Sedimenticola hydrogenitrophicus]